MRKVASWATDRLRRERPEEEAGPAEARQERGRPPTTSARPAKRGSAGEAGQPEERGRHVQRPDERAGDAGARCPGQRTRSGHVQDVVVQPAAVVDSLEVGPEALAVRRGQDEDRAPVEPGLRRGRRRSGRPPRPASATAPR